MAEDFDIYQFEDRVAELLASYRDLVKQHDALLKNHDALLGKQADTRARLQAVVDRIAALEAEAETPEA